MKNRAFKKKLVHATLTHDGVVLPKFSNLDSPDSVHVSAYHAGALIRAAIKQWEAEHGSVYGAYPVFRRADVVRLFVGSLILDLNALTSRNKKASDPTSAPPESEAPSSSTDSPDELPPLAPTALAIDDTLSALPATPEPPETQNPIINREKRRATMLDVLEILKADAAGEIEYLEDLEVRILAAPDAVLARSLVQGVQRGSVTTDAEGDIEWGDLQGIKRKLPLRAELVVDARLIGFQRGDSRKLSLTVLKVHSTQYDTAVRRATSRDGTVTVSYDSVGLEDRIMQITSGGFDIQYRATVTRGLAWDQDLEFLVHEADPIVDEKAVRGLSDAELLSELLLEVFKTKAGLV